MACVATQTTSSSSSRGGGALRAWRLSAALLALVGGLLLAPTASGAISEFAVPTPASFPASITPGPDGALWLPRATAKDRAGNDRGQLQRVHGRRLAPRHRRRARRRAVVHERAPTRSGGSRPRAASASSRCRRPRAALSGSPSGPTGRSGSPSTSPTRSGASRPGAASPSSRSRRPRARLCEITAGPDGALWFTEIRRQQDRAGHDRGQLQRVRGADARKRAVRDRRRARRGALVHRERRATRSGASRPRAASPSSGSRRPRAGRSGSPPGPTGRSGSPRPATRSGGSRPAGSFTEFPVPTPAGGPASRRARWGALVHRERGNKIGRITTDLNARPIPPHHLPSPRLQAVREPHACPQRAACLQLLLAGGPDRRRRGPLRPPRRLTSQAHIRPRGPGHGRRRGRCHDPARRHRRALELGDRRRLQPKPIRPRPDARLLAPISMPPVPSATRWS